MPFSSLCWLSSDLICLCTELALLMGVIDSSSKSRAQMGLCSGPLFSVSICCVDDTDGKSHISARPLHISLPGSLGGELMAGQRGKALKCWKALWAGGEKRLRIKQLGAEGRSFDESYIFNKVASTWNRQRRSIVSSPSPSTF